MQHFRLYNALLLAATCMIMASVVSTESALTCGNGLVQRLSCDFGVIIVEAALYGRANRYTCGTGLSPRLVANTNCAAERTMDIIKTRCDGKKVCELSTRTFPIPDPCPGTFKYLETNYTCVPAIHVVACEYSHARLYCDEGQVIHVYGADYGRYDRSTCALDRPFQQIANISCQGVSSKVAESCNGKNSCEVQAINSVFGNPCRGIFKYLQAAYVCEYPVGPVEEYPYYNEIKE